MNRRLVAFVAAWLWMLVGTSTAPRAAHPQQTPPTGSASVTGPPDRALVDRYCVSCHNERIKTGGLALDVTDPARIPEGAAVWEKVVAKLRAGAMPPAGAPAPSRAARQAFVSQLESALDAAVRDTPNPGPAVVHRLNRTEYANAIRDILALEMDMASLLPADDSSHGFDNISDVLGVSPVLLERYLSAAGKISALAVGDPTIEPSDETYRPRPDFTQTQHFDGLPLGTRGGMLIRHTFPLDGEYVIKPKLWQSNVGVIRGLSFPHDLEISIDGERVHFATVGTPDDYATLLENQSEAAATIDQRIQVRVPVKAGPRAIVVTFVERTAAQPPTLLQPFLTTHDAVDADGVPKVERVVVTGPFNATGSVDTPSRRRVFSCRPTRPGQEAPCAKQILSTLARQAYRRPVADADVQPLLGFYESGRRKGSFEAGIQMALRRILVSPAFIFRIERDAPGLASGAVHDVTDIELASRLSFFLWSSVPDDMLLSLASRNKLRDPTVLDQQVRRMLADPRAQSLASNFAGQWLYVRNLRSVSPDLNEFPNFDDNLRQGFQREMEMFFESIVREDRPVLDLLTADYTFVNERLARHYGMPNVYGSQFRRVPITEDARKGLLGKGSILTVTSQANRTSPVKRGKWILENVLGAPPPPPPANVPPLMEKSDALGVVPSMRAQMEVHRTNPVCANCHKLMDPLGLALENFDGIGGWRTRDGNTRIDASGELIDGTKVDGPTTLRSALVAQPDAFVNTMTQKLLTYALGRGLGHYDMPAVRSIVRAASSREYRFSALVLGIVQSVPFQRRAKPSADGGGAPAKVAAARRPF